MISMIIRVAFLALLLATTTQANDPFLVSRKRVPPEGIDGTLVIAGGGKLPAEVREEFIKRAGGKEAKIVVIPTASRLADAAKPERYLAPWKALKPKSVALMHTRSRKVADSEEFIRPLKEATGVWFGGGSQARIAAAYVGTKVEKELHVLLKRKGVIGGSSAGAAIMSRLMITGGNPLAKTGKGFDLLPDAVIDQHFTERKRKPRLLGVIAKQRGRFGLGIDESTAVLVRGRAMKVIGKGNVTIILGQNGPIPSKVTVVRSGRYADLTALRRAAVARTLKPFPQRNAKTPVVPSGSLLIVGGGGLTRKMMTEFVRLAGGPDALILYFPTAVPPRLAQRAKVPRYLTSAGAKNVKVMPQSELKEVESKEFLDLLKKAKGLWFGGGRQWRFVDAYAGTKAYALMHAVLNRGGVVGGSSAGASIQGGYLARANPLGNRDIMADGYERGFAFLPGVAIDQHFAQRRRFKDMTQLMARYPQLLGIGIDETTAIIVQKNIATVLGRNRVHFYNRRKPVRKPDYESLRAGGKYDLVTRRRLPVAAKRPMRKK